MPDDIATLEAEILERQERLHDLKTSPMTPAEAAELARSDPDAFNARYEACQRAGRNPVTYKED
jgi:hypothetical protein